MLTVPGIEWSTLRQTVVLFAQPDCAACRNSAEFYRALTKQLKSLPAFVFVVLSPDEPGVVGSWLTKERVSADLIAQVHESATSGLYLTPSILILDRSGVVDTILAGQLQPSEEQIVLARLAGAEGLRMISNVPDEINEAQLASLQQEGQSQLVDSRAKAAYLRSHRPGFVNLPFPDLLSRAKDELSTNRRVILDCPREVARSCPVVGTLLRQDGFGHVSLLFSGFGAK